MELASMGPEELVERMAQTTKTYNPRTGVKEVWTYKYVEPIDHARGGGLLLLH